MKFRIVKTEDGSFRIQTSLFGLFWHFYSVPTVYYSEYEKGFVQDTIVNRSFLYDTKREAEETIEIMKKGSSFYRKFSIDSMFIKDCGEYECKYFVTKGFFGTVYDEYFDTLEDAKKHIDNYWEKKENEKKKDKVKKVINYY